MVRPPRAGAWTPPLLALLAASALAACTGSEATAPRGPESAPWLPARASAAGRARVVVLGLDGLDGVLLDRMLEAGALPAFAALAQQGLRADVSVPEPIMSPLLWTTMASGYPAEVHGIGGWARPNGAAYTGADVRVARIWDRLAARGEASVVCGWLMTWPAAPIPGALLSDRFAWTPPMDRAGTSGTPPGPVERWGLASPDALLTLAETQIPGPSWLAASPLGAQVAEASVPGFVHPYARDESHLRVFEAVWPKAGARLGAVYLAMADQVSHLHWADPVPGEAPTGRVPDVYRVLDGVVRRVRAVIDADTTLLVVSDHGFRGGVEAGAGVAVGQHRDPAVLLAVGPSVRGTGMRAALDVLDIGPTVAALLGLPPAADQPGRVRDDLFRIARLPPTVDSWRLDVDATDALAVDEAPGADAVRAQLQALGYLDARGRPVTGVSRRAR
ncbi:MAG: hypothetical protein RLZZ299_141 [Pseudomonadota bacterium]